MAVISVDYNEGTDLKYNFLKFHPDNGDDFIFKSKNFVKDWYDMMKMVLSDKVGVNYYTGLSSSVHHFVSDTGLYESRFLISQNAENTHWAFEKTNPSGDAYEFFVPRGWKGGWKELKDTYDGKRNV